MNRKTTTLIQLESAKSSYLLPPPLSKQGQICGGGKKTRLAFRSGVEVSAPRAPRPHGAGPRGAGSRQGAGRTFSTIQGPRGSRRGGRGAGKKMSAPSRGGSPCSALPARGSGTPAPQPQPPPREAGTRRSTHRLGNTDPAGGVASPRLGGGGWLANSAGGRGRRETNNPPQ